MRINSQLTPTIILSLDDETFLFKSLRGGPRIRVHDIRIQEDRFWLLGYRRFSQIHHEVPEGFRMASVVPEMPPVVKDEVTRLMQFLGSEAVTRHARRLRQEMAYNLPAQV